MNAELLGSPKTQMIGNVIQGRFLAQNDYPTAAALAFILMAAILLVDLPSTPALLGTDELTRWDGMSDVRIGRGRLRRMPRGEPKPMRARPAFRGSLARCRCF